MLNLSKVSSGSGELIEIDISSVFAERSSERSSPVLSLRIGLLRKALRALDAGYSIGALCRALCKCRFLSAAEEERSDERSAALLLGSALTSALLLLATSSCCWRALWRAHCCCWLLSAAAAELSAERSARDLVFRRAPRSLLSVVAVSYSDWSSLSSAPRAI